MDSTVLSVSWKDHSGALTEVCKTLLDNNFLVDCTIAAEGKALKAHRLILSACSPYFQMLFGEDCEKHPIVIIQNASFETLKAMVDFMYHGETQVPEERLEAFLTLAETLQIKGLNDSSKKNRRKLQPVDSTRETRHRLPPEDQKVTCEVQIASASHEPSPENSSEQHHSYHSEEYTDVTENCSVSLEGNNSSYEPVKSTSVIQSSQQMPPLPEQESRDAEHNVKSEPMHHVYLVPKHEQMDEDEGDEPPQDVSECDINEEATSGFDEQHMNQYSSVPSCSDSGNVLPGAFAMPQMAGPPDVQVWCSEDENYGDFVNREASTRGIYLNDTTANAAIFGSANGNMILDMSYESSPLSGSVVLTSPSKEGLKRVRNKEKCLKKIEKFGNDVSIDPYK
ncbi:Longitudinals lacking protein, isoforms H/M/V [Gryllus bimaculatus]|nr:Longitudinals lacking protein, isoforms H/M/V [Gryllus bimaculatus]